MSDCGHSPPWPDDFPADSPVRNNLGWSLGTPREDLRRARMLPCPTCRLERIEQLAADAPEWVNPLTEPTGQPETTKGRIGSPPRPPRLGRWVATIRPRRWFAPWYVIELNTEGGAAGYQIPPRRRALTEASAWAKARAWVAEKAEPAPDRVVGRVTEECP